MKSSKLIEEKSVVDYSRAQIMDVGYGTGHLLYFFQKKFNPKSISGWEFSKKAHQFALKLVPKALFYHGSIEEKSNDKEYDIIFCTQVLEHLLNPEKALNNMVKMLKTNGTLMLTVPNG